MMSTPLRPFALIAVATCFVVGSSSVTRRSIADELDVLSRAELKTPAQRLVYERLLAEAHVALDRRSASVEQLLTPDSIHQYQAKQREFFVQQLGGFPARGPLNAHVTGRIVKDRYSIEKLIFESQPSHHVTANMYLPATTPPYPCVVVASGHSRTAKAADYNQRFGIIMAMNGMAALVYDPIGQGERSMLLDESGKNRIAGTTDEHLEIGIGSILVGTNTAKYRIWDAMRAIDYAQSRDDIRGDRIGFTGCSGGGTITSYVMALDDRVLCAAPSCYLTTLRHLVDTIGPQDSEQNVFGQIAFGMDHADYAIMRAPRPTLISSTTDDFFSIDGTWESFRQAKRIYGRLGRPEQISLVEGDGGHGVPLGNLNAIMRWMQRWLLDQNEMAITTEFDILAEKDLQCTPGGQVLLLEGERSVFDLNLEQATAFAPQRERFAQLSRDDQVKRIRELSGVRPPDELPKLQERSLGIIQRSGYTIERVLLEGEASVPIPCLLYRPAQERSDLAYLIAHGKGKRGAEQQDRLRELLAAGHVVLSVDLPGLGETRSEKAEGRYGDWKTYFLAYMLDKSYVGIRAEALLQAANYLRAKTQATGVHLLASGEASIPALHAAAVSEAFARVELQDSVTSWQAALTDRVRPNQLVDTIHGVLQTYDLPHLVILHGNVEFSNE